ncbi:NEAT domain-containing protein [Clostridium nigeriense]|uniref:NEAT domain-containing protein n=1 Tax=Clostridium nigeriense TaxID=1805470 RepID=UPI003D33529C
MKILNKLKKVLMITMVLGIFFTLGSKNVYAITDDIVSGIYEVENDVYHESETGMAMSRTYLLPTMTLEVTKEHIIYTIGFSGSDYMENYRIKVNGEEVPVELVEDNNEEGTVKLKVEVDKVDADMDALIYVGPMERDVEFKVIPKIETLNLIETIEEEIEEKSEEEIISTEEVREEEIESTTKNNNGAIVIIGVALVVVVGALIVVKRKKK